MDARTAKQVAESMYTVELMTTQWGRVSATAQVSLLLRSMYVPVEGLIHSFTVCHLSDSIGTASQEQEVLS
jgi:hypothetical protein